jgi:hypothetical protein
VLGEITNIQRIARGSSIRIRHFLNRQFAQSRRVTWIKRKGFALIQWRDTGKIEYAELHWFEAHGIGRVYITYKRGIER